MAFQPDGKLVAAAGSDGIVRLIDATNGSIVRQFSPAPLSNDRFAAGRIHENGANRAGPHTRPAAKPKSCPPRWQSSPSKSHRRRFRSSGGSMSRNSSSRRLPPAASALDVTRMAKYHPSSPIVSVNAGGFVRALADGSSDLTVTVGSQSAQIPVTVSDATAEFHADFVHDVAPLLSRIGCTAGTCHGAQAGKNGFKLSLRGYDPINDVRALTDDLASRRVAIASPDNSLMLLKSTGAVPHIGGSLIQPGDP